MYETQVKWSGKFGTKLYTKSVIFHSKFLLGKVFPARLRKATWNVDLCQHDLPVLPLQSAVRTETPSLTFRTTALRPCVCYGQVHGKSVGGDADELRLLSTSKTYINLRAHGGSLDFVSTKVIVSVVLFHFRKR